MSGLPIALLLVVLGLSNDLAVGNLLGSNAANMAMILIVGIAFRPGPILAAVDDTHTVAATAVILLMALALAGIISGQTNRARRLEPNGIVLLVAYAASIAAVAVAS